MNYYICYSEMLMLGGMTFSHARAVDSWIWQYVRMQPFLFKGFLNQNKRIWKLTGLWICGSELWMGSNYKKKS